jgi:hypothetical protein
LFTPQRPKFWISLLLAAGVFWSAAAFVEDPTPHSKIKGNATTKNPSRQSARAEVMAAAAVRAQTDQQYQRYVEALTRHNQAVKAFVQARRGAR